MAVSPSIKDLVPLGGGTEGEAEQEQEADNQRLHIVGFLIPDFVRGGFLPVARLRWDDGSVAIEAGIYISEERAIQLGLIAPPRPPNFHHQEPAPSRSGPSFADFRVGCARATAWLCKAVAAAVVEVTAPHLAPQLFPF